MGGQACRTKIILNGGMVQDLASRLCYEIKEAEEIDNSYGYEIVRQLNIAENAMFKAQRLFLESQGFTGPWPYSLTQSRSQNYESPDLIEPH